MSDYTQASLTRVSRLIDRPAIQRYAVISDDFNPIHIDPEFAAGTSMGGIIAHGMLSLALVWQSLRATYGPNAQAGARLTVRFTRPVRENDTVSAYGRLRAGEVGIYDVFVENQRSEAVIKGTLALAD
jgi:acyl dehydratase